MEGLGNDFIVIEGADVPSPGDVRRWCRRHAGVGADGVLTAQRLGPGRVRMRYWNADGGEAEMCGNGLRCVALLARSRSWVDGDVFVVESAAGDHPVEVRPNGTIRAFAGAVDRLRVDDLSVAGKTVHPVRIGNPHAVLFVDDVETAEVTELGPRIESDALFPDGVNVEFVETIDTNRIEVRVWERGVGETRASGTGAAAAAYLAVDRGMVEAPVTVSLAGGDLLIEFDEAGAWMTGPATEVFSGSVE